MWNDFQAEDYNEDCIESEPAYQPVDEIIMQVENELAEEDCDGEAIEEYASLDDVDIEVEAANINEDDLYGISEIYQPSDRLASSQEDEVVQGDFEEYVEEECEDEYEEEGDNAYGQGQAPEPIVVEEPENNYVEVEGCEGDEEDSEPLPIDEDEYVPLDYEQEAFNILEHVQKAQREEDLYIENGMEDLQEDCEEEYWNVV